jgi:plasmid replication initiation protein
LKQKPLIIPNHFDAQTGTYLDLVTSWFDTAYVGRNGAGYFAVTISQVLKPYLLQVKREFFRFRLFHVMQLRSSYAIRLYQWAKRWEFRKNMEISVQELRNVLGANSGPDGHGTKLNLGAYADFKRRAINPAVAEINEKTDLTVSFRELKAKGSKERVSRAEALHQIKNCQQARA